MSNVTLGPVVANVTSSTCTPIILDVVISTASVILFLVTIFITYMIDDPGLKRLKLTDNKKDLTVVTEADSRYINYLTEHKFNIHTKGHTFSSFSPARRAPDDISQVNADSITQGGWKPRRRACSESHPGTIDDNMSETQVILEHMFFPLKHGSSQHSLRGRSSNRHSSSSTKRNKHGSESVGQNAPTCLDEVTRC